MRWMGLVVLAVSCAAPPPQMAPSDPAPPAAPSSPLTPAQNQPKPPAPPEPTEEARQVMLTAAATDLKEPFLVADPEATGPPDRWRQWRKLELNPNEHWSPYFKYGQLLGVLPTTSRSLEIVTEALSKMGEEGRRALVAWVVNPQANLIHRGTAYRTLARGALRSDDLPACLALLEAYKHHDLETSGFPSGDTPLQRVLGGRIKAVARVGLLMDIASIGTPEARAVLLQLANDQSLTEPKPETMASFHCAKGIVREEAQALGSVRLWAVSLLDDEPLWRLIRDDPSEPRWFRVWMQRLLDKQPFAAAERAGEQPLGAMPPPKPCVYR